MTLSFSYVESYRLFVIPLTYNVIPLETTNRVVIGHIRRYESLKQTQNCSSVAI
jgi:hypothetical protein